MIYLATPYSDPEPAVREQRFRDACRTAACLMRAGHVVFSPIAHGHSIALHGLPTDWTFWERHCREQLARCDELMVLMLEGWRESVGVQAEIQIAGEFGKPVRYLAPAEAAGRVTLAHVAKEGAV